jgi:hypothetical protein
VRREWCVANDSLRRILLKKSLPRGLATKLGNNDSNAAGVLNHYCVNEAHRGTILPTNSRRRLFQRYRRICVIPLGAGEGLLTEAKAVVPDGQQELF